jgi:hypothetical protein
MLVLPPLAAETMFYVSGFPITNSYIYSTLALIGFAVFSFFVNKGIKKYYLTTDVPKGILNFAEGLIEPATSGLEVPCSSN